LKVNIDAELLKRVGAIIIVATAFCIILPGVGQYFTSLARVAIFICAVIAVAFTFAIVSVKLAGKKLAGKVNDKSEDG
jgi:hypothetical protein